MLVLYFILLIKSLVVIVSSSPFQLVAVDGIAKSSKLINKYITTDNNNDDNSKKNIINIIDCTTDKCYDLINSLFDTSFDGDNGITLEISNSNILLCSTFDSMVSSSFCGSKVIDYSCSLSNNICITMKGTDLLLNLQGYDQILRRLIKYVNNNRDSSPMSVVFILDAADDENHSEIITNYLELLWSELATKAKLTDALDIKVITVDSTDESSITNAKEIITNNFASVSTEMSVKELADKLSSQWDGIPSTIRPLLSPAQREAVYLIESAYAAAIAHADVQINQWQTRVASGKTVGNFAERVSVLEKTVKKDFNKKVVGATQLAVRERGERLRMIEDHILRQAQRLFRQQLLVLEFTVTNDFRRDLIKIIARTDLADDSERGDQQQQALRRAIFQYKALAAKLEDSSLGLVLEESLINDLTSTLEEIMREFPETAVAQLEEVRKAERIARSSRGEGGGGRRKKKGFARALGVSLSLVGMLRPPGYGNLQGFIGYATSLFGLPADLLLGVQNDGDSPEIMGEDREYPILRIQPKVNFDIDL